MKTYRVSRLYRWSRFGAKILLTGLGGVLYVLAVTHPTPAGLAIIAPGRTGSLRLALLCALAQDADRDHDLGRWLGELPEPCGATRVQAADIRSIGRSFGRRTLRVQHAGGQLQLPNRYKKLLDFLFTMKGLNPAIEIRGF